MNSHQELPWAAPALLCGEDGTLQRLSTGTVLTAEEAAQIFGRSHDPSASYIVSDDGMARRVVDEETAETNGLRWTFSGVTCPQGHLTTRRRRNDPRRGSECKSCRAARKRRIANPARPERASRNSSHPTGGPMKMD